MSGLPDVWNILGFKISKSTVKQILVDNGISIDPEQRKHIDWELFISSHKDVLAATDFFTAEVLRKKSITALYVPFSLTSVHGKFK